MMCRLLWLLPLTDILLVQPTLAVLGSVLGPTAERERAYRRLSWRSKIRLRSRFRAPPLLCPPKRVGLFMDSAFGSSLAPAITRSLALSLSCGAFLHALRLQSSAH